MRARYVAGLLVGLLASIPALAVGDSPTPIGLKGAKRIAIAVTIGGGLSESDRGTFRLFGGDKQRADRFESRLRAALERAQQRVAHAASRLLRALTRRGAHHQRSQGNQGGAAAIPGAAKEMKREYDFSKARRNPYARRLKRQITIRLDAPTVEYFKRAARETGIPYQTLINLYLRDCAERQRKLSMEWKASA